MSKERSSHPAKKRSHPSVGSIVGSPCCWAHPEPYDETLQINQICEAGIPTARMTPVPMVSILLHQIPLKTPKPFGINLGWGIDPSQFISEQWGPDETLNSCCAPSMGQSGQRYILEKRNYKKMAKTLSDLYK